MTEDISFNKGKYITTLPCGNQCSQKCYSEVSEQDVKEYISTLISYGYCQSESFLKGKNIFVTLTKNNEFLHLSYTAHDSILRILRDPLLQTVYIPKGEPFDKITSTSLSVIPLDYSHREITDGNGMSFAITLEDGSYIIIDGGYGDYAENTFKKSPEDAEILYDFLKSNNKRKDQKINITAWIFTHPHADHYGAFIKFSKAHSKDVAIKHFIFNHGDPSTYAKDYQPDNFLSETIFAITSERYANADFIKPHVGQTLSFCNTELKFFFTQELCAPHIAPAVNDSSLVFQMRTPDKSALFMADCDKTISNLLVKIYGDSLKSDIMQINHHGYSGVTEELFDCVSPEVTIWPTSKEAFKKRITGTPYQYIGNAVSANKYIFDKLGNDGCIVADKEIKTIQF